MTTEGRKTTWHLQVVDNECKITTKKREKQEICNFSVKKCRKNLVDTQKMCNFASSS